MQLFSADAKMFLKKKLNYFFANENMKKTSSKTAHNSYSFIFFLIALSCPMDVSIETSMAAHMAKK